MIPCTSGSGDLDNGVKRVRDIGIRHRLCGSLSRPGLRPSGHWSPNDRRSGMRRARLLFVIPLLLGGCVKSSTEAKPGEMRQYLAQCSELLGYVPSRVGMADESQVARREHESRACSYAALEKVPPRTTDRIRANWSIRVVNIFS